VTEDETAFEHHDVSPAPYDWARLTSWHLLPLGSWTTLCGREVASRARVPFPPSDAPTCETCFQIRESRKAKETA
jgi:hypothetical protein